MKKYLLLLLLPLLFIGCTPAEKKKTGKLTIAAGLPPIAAIAAAVAGEDAEVISLLPAGRTPHDFSPKAADIRKAHQAAFFLSAGLPFEKKLAASLPEKVRLIDAGRGIARLPMTIGHHHDDGRETEAEPHRHHDAEGTDPHFWLSPLNAAAIAGNVLTALTAADPAHAGKFQANCQKFQQEMTALDAELKQKLEPFRGRTVLVYHPAFGYFTAAYGLRQEAIELDGREVNASRLAAIIRQAREEKISAIFVQKQFNQATAKVLAAQLQAEVIESDPLPPDPAAEFRRFAEAVAAGNRPADK